jgi:hypothetical protein
MRGFRLFLVLWVVVVVAPAVAQAARPVASLEPAKTERLWRQLVARGPLKAQQDCRPLRGVFYAQTDWLRLATKLAAAASPCAQYYVSVPPMLADKSQLRAGEAERIRALGQNFHALAEIHFTGWTRWVASTGKSWFDAGVTARERMTAAGYDVTKGDTWVVNELSSAVRRGVGNARANVLEFLRGLFEGSGVDARGAVFVIGVGQTLGDASVYQVTMQNWYADNVFWPQVAQYVSDWSQEVYPDVRRFAVPGQPTEVRRDYLNDYLQHVLVLAAGGPPTIAAAKALLGATYSPLANAAWQWQSGYGWTFVPVEQMQPFVSAQVYALRFFSATTGQPQDHWGFAWAPRNASELPASQFAAQTGSVLDRLATAIRDSAQPVDPGNPGIGACGVGAALCATDLEGASFLESWKGLRAWSQPVLSLTTSPEPLTAGVPFTLTLSLIVASGAPQPPAVPVTVSLATSSGGGGFSLSPEGPWTNPLPVAIPPGVAAPVVYYRDTRAGLAVVTATAPGYTNAIQPQPVAAGPPSAVTIAPTSASIASRGKQKFSATAADAFGNPVAVTPRWTADPPTLGNFTSVAGTETTFVAGGRGGTATITATVTTPAGPVTGTAQLTIAPGRIKVGSVRYGVGRGVLLVTPRVIEGGGRPVAGARVFVLVRRDARRAFSGSKLTASDGRATFRLLKRRGRACYTTVIRNVAAPGYKWDRVTPANRFCVR